jgi:tRNA-2-methylthio-N6-dimethylallyladenosine synthase
MEKKIFIKTFGCQMNEYDSNRIYDSLKKIGYKKTKEQVNADCYILNTCHIRDKAKEKVYHEIGRVKKTFRNKKKPMVIVAGCVAQAENQEMLKREPYIDIVMGPQSYHKINKTILNYLNIKKKQEQTDFDTIAKFDYLEKIKNSDNKISSFLTIQEGCDKFCHFCVVPYTRGPEYSRPFKQIIDEVENLISNGTKEIIFLGQNVNAYKYDKYRLSDLILKIEKYKEIKRIRYTTSHPNDMTEDLLEVYKTSKKLMPLVHLPVQSGSNKILKLMNRKHTIEEYIKIYDKLKKINSNIEFSSDFIIAYPEENEKDFQSTLQLLDKIKFINSYSFIFSPRPGTVASELKLINKEISQKRLEVIQNLLFEEQIKKNKSLVNKIIPVLVENQMKDKKKLFGRSEHMTSVIFNGKEENIGKLIPVKIIGSNKNTLFGKMIENYNKKVA